ncbi:MAG: hypothetical protein ABJB97_03355 [Acidobacteriota bacterium]
MIRHVWSVLCSRMIVDATSNNATLIDVIESIQIALTEPEPGSTPPAPTDRVTLPLQATFVTLWSRADLDVPVAGTQRIRLLSHRGTAMVSVESPIELEIGRRFRHLGSINGLPTEGSGTCEIEVSWKVLPDDQWNVAARIPIEVTITPTPPADIPDEVNSVH